MTANEVAMKCKELKELQRLIEEAQAEAEAIKDQIKAHMGDSEFLTVGEYRVTWKPVTSSRLDTSALRKAAPELCEKFTRSVETKRFCVA